MTDTQEISTQDVASVATGKLDAMIKQSQAQSAPQPYDFATPEFEFPFKVVWPNKDGHIYVTHKLRRPTFGELLDWKKKIVVEREYDKAGLQRESVLTAVADQWLWNQIALAFTGYPDLAGWTAVTDHHREKMRSTHKEQAVSYLFKAEVDILFEESIATYDGGEWVVALKINHYDAENPPVVKFRFREWTQKERSDFTKLGTISNSKSEGKNTITQSSVNLRTFADLFDALLIDVEGGVVRGKRLVEIGREEFAREVFAEFKAVIIAELTVTWRKHLGD
jgi:hypothetical protein